MNYLYTGLLTALCVGWTLIAFGQQSGQVWQDANANGRQDGSEPGIASISVKAYDRKGQLVAETRSQSDGRYHLTIPTGQPIRLTFGNLPSGLTPLPGHYLHSFIKSSPLEVNLALYQPQAYSGGSLRVALSMQPLGNHKAGESDTLSTVIVVDALKNRKESKLWAKPVVTGSIWSLAFDRAKQRLFSASLAKRHSGFGVLGSGGIYVTDLVAGETKPFVDLGKLGIVTGPNSLERDLSGDLQDRMLDSLMYPLVGKMSLGGMDYADDERILYVMNLFDRRLYALLLPEDGSAPSSQQVQRYTIPDPGCKGGVFRPFAVKYHAGKVYIGGVCDAQESGKTKDLKAYVYALNPTSRKFSEVISIPLDYQRGAIEYGVGNWFAWTDDNQKTMLADPAWWSIHPQPMLSDLEFDQDGSLILGFMDRLGHQKATGKGTPDGRWKQSVAMAAGDVLRVAAVKRHFEIERNGRIGKNQTKGIDNQQGPGGGEFYFDDTFTINETQYHQENGMGGLALLPTTGQLLGSVREPVAERNSGGLVWLNNQTGVKENGLAVYHHNPDQEFVARKTNHIGDVELITEAPPMQIGHRIWQDCDEDGMQDADEIGMAGVRVELWRKGKQLASTVSDSLGIYSFDSRSIPGGVLAKTSYEIRIAYTQERYKKLSLSTADPAVDPTINNDGVDRQEYAVILFTTEALGVSSNSLDFGFKCVEKPQVEATVACTGTHAADAMVRVTLKGFKADERFDLTPAKEYNGKTDYASAEPIPATGLIFDKPLLDWESGDLMARVINQSGCYQEVYVSLLQSKECLKLFSEQSNTASGRLHISPNPTPDKVVVQYRGMNNSPVVIQVLNGSGKVLQQESLSGPSDALYRKTLDLSRYPSGLYLISLQQGNTVLSRKIIRQ